LCQNGTELNDTVEDIKYLCMCDPTANVAVEILCSLVKGKTFEEVELITEDSFTGVIGGNSEDLLKRAKGLLDLLNIGIQRYQAECS
jgi:NifU-like protein involved in Fe-S cluster formation